MRLIAPAATARRDGATGLGTIIMTTAGRRLAEDGLAQARQAYERYAEAGEIALNAFETTTGRMVASLRTLAGTGQAQATLGGAPANDYEAAAGRSWAGLRQITQRVLVATDANMRAGFDHAESLIRARDAREAAELQAAYLRAQTARFAEQMLDLQKTATRVARSLAAGTAQGTADGARGTERP
jgi:hypothetical protein